MNTTNDGLWPTDLTFNRTARQLEIGFNDGREFNLPFELLRVESPSAEVQGHGGDQKQIVPGKSQVNVERAKTQGNYAVRIVFDDGHDSGIFSWDYLYELGTNQEFIWAAYLTALTDAGLTRS
jgi:DUF971 family protein